MNIKSIKQRDNMSAASLGSLNPLAFFIFLFFLKRDLHTLTFSQHTYLFLSLLSPLSFFFPSDSQPIVLLLLSCAVCSLSLHPSSPPSPSPALTLLSPPTRLLIHPLREQYRGELTTVITIALSYDG